MNTLVHRNVPPAVSSVLETDISLEVCWQGVILLLLLHRLSVDERGKFKMPLCSTHTHMVSYTTCNKHLVESELAVGEQHRKDVSLNCGISSIQVKIHRAPHHTTNSFA